MKQAYLLLTCIIFISTLFAAGQPSDRIIVPDLGLNSQNDSIRVDELNTSIKTDIDYGNYDVALKNAVEALSLADKINYLKGKANVYHWIGEIFYQRGDYTEAINRSSDALRIRQAIGDKSGIAYSFNSIANIYHVQNMLPDAMTYYENSLQIRKEIDDKQGIATCFSNIGEIFRKEGNYTKALTNASVALKLREEIADKKGLADSHGNIGIIYAEQGNFNEAMTETKFALKIEEDIADKQGMIVSYYTIGHIALELKNYSEAESYLNKSLALAMELGHKNEMLECYGLLKELYKKLNNPLKALSYFETYVELKDAIMKKENAISLASIPYMKLLNKKLEAIQAATELKNKQETERVREQNYERIGYIGAFALMTLFAGIFFRQRNRISSERQKSEEERKKNERLILNILPKETAEELKIKGHVKPMKYDMVSVMFIDFDNFTQISQNMKPEELVSELHYCFSKFDSIIAKHHLEKIKTLGDGYMCAGGLPVENNSNPEDAVRGAIEILDFLKQRRKDRIEHNKLFFEARIGIHTGPVVAGIVGTKKYSYDIWGDTVNIASRMESSGETGKINISSTTYELVKTKFDCSDRGYIEAKNKGRIDMHFVNEDSIVQLSKKRKQTFVLKSSAESIINDKK
jgi:adenylate cyclase